MSTSSESSKRVLITGAAGHIGMGFARATHKDYDLVLLDLPGRLPDEARELGELVEADLRNLDALKRATEGVHTVIHLAGYRQAATLWNDLLTVNIVGTYNVVAAALAQGCQRVIFASSIHAVSGYPTTRQLREDDPVNPGDLYGVSKVFGEALGRYASEQEGLSFVVLRIGAFQQVEVATSPGSGWLLQDYCAPEDLYRLLRLCVDEPDLRFEIFNAISANRYPRMDMSKARRVLGFEPEFDAFALAPGVADAIDAAGPPAETPPSGMRDDLSADDPTTRTQS